MDCRVLVKTLQPIVTLRATRFQIQVQPFRIERRYIGAAGAAAGELAAARVWRAAIDHVVQDRARGRPWYEAARP